MADASGTPTPLGIPTFNTAVDPPSGKGFNTAMSVIDTLLSTRATETLTSNTKTALQLSGAAAGLTIGGDANLYRSLAQRVASDGEIHARSGAAAEVGIGAWGPASQSGITFGSGHDTNLYRLASNVLATDGRLFVSENTANTVGIGAQGPSGQAAVVFGSAADTNLYRFAAGRLFTDGSIEAPSSYVLGNLLITGSMSTTGQQSHCILIQNAAVDTGTPSGGGSLYTLGGALKYRGSSGTITTIAPA